MTTIGFIGLGVMGAPMCRNMAAKHPGPVIAFDLAAEASEALAGAEVRLASQVDEVWDLADVAFLSVPGAREVEALCIGPGGLAGRDRKPATVVDLSTTSVATARRVAEVLGQAGVAFADAPVARTREAAQKGELSIMVGASDELFKTVEPLLRYIGTDVTHTGGVGSGQFVKLVNNALLDVNVIAIAEAVVLAQKAGVDPAVMVETVWKGSGDSYALRNHAVKSILPRIYPENAFPPKYKLKDLNYLLELGKELKSPLRSAELAYSYYEKAVELGFGSRYFPIVREVIERQGEPD
jgi:3-hydroxyisobutyrate dehydrogenase-like beta-hydroxyacid dehydrogenase